MLDRTSSSRRTANRNRSRLVSMTTLSSRTGRATRPAPSILHPVDALQQLVNAPDVLGGCVQQAAAGIRLQSPRPRRAIGVPPQSGGPASHTPTESIAMRCTPRPTMTRRRWSTRSLVCSLLLLALAAGAGDGQADGPP